MGWVGRQVDDPGVRDPVFLQLLDQELRLEVAVGVFLGFAVAVDAGDENLVLQGHVARGFVDDGGQDVLGQKGRRNAAAELGGQDPRRQQQDQGQRLDRLHVSLLEESVPRASGMGAEAPEPPHHAIPAGEGKGFSPPGAIFLRPGRRRRTAAPKSRRRAGPRSRGSRPSSRASPWTCRRRRSPGTRRRRRPRSMGWKIIRASSTRPSL